MAARIPVFLSAPTALSIEQNRSYSFIQSLLDDEGLEPRALGRTDYGVDSPLKEVYSIATHCAGGVILGFTQMLAPTLVVKPGTDHESNRADYPLPTPWNNLEAGILFALRKPLIVFRQRGIEGGVFDHGATDLYVQSLPGNEPSPEEAARVRSVIKAWVGKVRETYRDS